MLLMVEKEISGRICHAAHRYVKANNKYMKNDNLKKNIKKIINKLKKGIFISSILRCKQFV